MKKLFNWAEENDRDRFKIGSGKSRHENERRANSIRKFVNFQVANERKVRTDSLWGNKKTELTWIKQYWYEMDSFKLKFVRYCVWIEKENAIMNL